MGQDALENINAPDSALHSMSLDPQHFAYFSLNLVERMNGERSLFPVYAKLMHSTFRNALPLNYRKGEIKVLRISLFHEVSWAFLTVYCLVLDVCKTLPGLILCGSQISHSFP